jgi:hypothetical protein
MSTLTYEEFVAELTRLYNDETIDGERAVVLLATEHPTHAVRYCHEEGLLDEVED